MFEPDRSRLVVTRETFFRRALKDRGIEICRVYLQYIDDVFPGKINGFLFEIIAERPVAKHLEHRVVVRIVPHFLQVIVLAADAQTFLAVCYARVFNRVIAEDDTLPGVHAGVGKHQSGVVFYDHRRGWYDLVTLRRHKI